MRILLSKKKSRLLHEILNCTIIKQEKKLKLLINYRKVFNKQLFHTLFAGPMSNFKDINKYVSHGNLSKTAILTLNHWKCTLINKNPKYFYIIGKSNNIEFQWYTKFVQSIELYEQTLSLNMRFSYFFLVHICEIKD